MPLIYIGISWIAGIALGPFVKLPLWIPLISLPFFIVAILIRGNRKPFILIALCIISFAVGILRFQSSVEPVNDKQLRFYNDAASVTVVGMISDQPEIHGRSITFRLSCSRITVEDKTFPIGGDALVRLPFYKDIHYGDLIQLSGKVETPENYADFDYKRYLSNRGIYSVINYPSIQVLQKDNGVSLLGWIYSLRIIMADAISRIIPQPQAALAQAILLGIRSNLPQNLVQSFYNTGTTHLIAISGLNLTIILGVVLSLSIWLFGRRHHLYIWISFFSIWLYTLLTGMPATLVRAAIMGSLFLVAEMLGRQRSGFIALTFAAILMLSIDPHLLWDTSFQLSFLSMLGLTVASPLLIGVANASWEKKHSSYLLRFKKVIFTIFGTTLAAILATLPVTVLNFHFLSLVSIPTTFFAMPSLPGIMVTSLLASISGLIWTPLGFIFGGVAWLFLSYFILIIDIFDTLPLAGVSGLHIEVWQAAIYYIILVGGTLMIIYRSAVKNSYSRLITHFRFIIEYIRNKLPVRSYIHQTISILLIADILIWVAILNLPDGNLHISVLDIGQGESILIRTPQGNNILIDSGPDPSAVCAQIDRKIPFWDRSINLIILTQLQADHISGTVDVLKNYKVKKLAIPAMPFTTVLGNTVIDYAKNKRIEISELHAGQVMDVGKDLSIAVLNPPKIIHSGTSDDINNNSLVLKVYYRNVSFLLTADIEKAAENYLISSRADLPSTVLKVAHHGSKGSTTPDFLEIVNPRAAVISVGANNRFGHPSREVVEHLKEVIGDEHVFITSINGTVEFTTDGRRLWYAVQKKP